MKDKNVTSETNNELLSEQNQPEVSENTNNKNSLPNDAQLENDSSNNNAESWLNDNTSQSQLDNISQNELKEESNSSELSQQQLSEQEQLMSKIKELEQQVAGINDKYIRLLAEFDNFRKRTRKEKEDLIKYAGEEVWKSILPILDDFERALKENQNTNDIEVVKKGFELIYNKIKHIIAQNKITAIDCLHKEFNADIMEAVAKVPAPSEDMKGKVIEELEKAYQLHDKLIRFAKVVVGE